MRSFLLMVFLISLSFLLAACSFSSSSNMDKTSEEEVVSNGGTVTEESLEDDTDENVSSSEDSIEDDNDVEDAEMKDILLEKSELIFTSLKNHNWNEIAEMTHSDDLIFAHFADLGSPYSTEVLINKEDLIKNIQEEIVWIEGPEGEVKKTLDEYVGEILFKSNELNYDTVNFNSSSVDSGGIINTISENYPEAKYVEYYSKATDESGYNWQALRFVFKEHDSEWLLFAIVRDVHSP